jgi:hypothetical protein
MPSFIFENRMMPKEFRDVFKLLSENDGVLIPSIVSEAIAGTIEGRPNQGLSPAKGNDPEASTILKARSSLN